MTHPLLNQLLANADIRRNTDDNSWDYLQQLSQNCRLLIYDINKIVLEAVYFLDAQKAFTGEARVLIEGLQKDITAYAIKWKTLSELHVGRTGLGKGQNEHSIILNTGLEYIQAHEGFIQITSLAVPRIQEIVNFETSKLQLEIQNTAIATPSEILNQNI